MKLRIIGPGRAGTSFARAWRQVGVETELLDRDAPIEGAAVGVDAVMIATPDGAIGDVAAAISPGDGVVLHCSGASGLDVLEGHERTGSIHPLMALPDADTGAARLLDDGWFAVAGDTLTIELVDFLGGRHFDVADDKRALYHATAAIAANHLVALLGQVERLADEVGVPVEAFLTMSRGSLGDVEIKGAKQALTGPASRNDRATLAAHRAALPAHEVELYDTLVAAAQRLATQD